jgi:hypothetical protein
MAPIHLPSRLVRIGAAVGAPLLAGWLASGSCTVVACYEECDPCFQACKCSSNCQNPLAGEGGFRIAEYEARVVADGPGRTLRTFLAIVGPELPCAGGPDPCDEASVAAFSRHVLDVNATLFTAERDPVWLLDAVTPLGAGVAAHFQLASARVGAPVHSITLLLDPRGRLVEIDQVLDRGSR